MYNTLFHSHEIEHQLYLGINLFKEFKMVDRVESLTVEFKDWGELNNSNGARKILFKNLNTNFEQYLGSNKKGFTNFQIKAKNGIMHIVALHDSWSIFYTDLRSGDLRFPYSFIHKKNYVIYNDRCDRYCDLVNHSTFHVLSYTELLNEFEYMFDSGIISIK